MKHISSSVESLVIQGGVCMHCLSLTLADLHSLTSLEMGYQAFRDCSTIVFQSNILDMNYKWDLIRLQSITLGYEALACINNDNMSITLTMNSLNDDASDWLDLPSLSLLKGEGQNFISVDNVILYGNDCWWDIMKISHYYYQHKYIWINLSFMWVNWRV